MAHSTHFIEEFEHFVEDSFAETALVEARDFTKEEGKLWENFRKEFEKGFMMVAFAEAGEKLLV